MSHKPVLIFHNSNNRKTMEALKRVGARNILVQYRYMHKHIDELISSFDKVLVIPGKIDDVDKYHYFVKKYISRLYAAMQYDVPLDMEETIKYYRLGERVGVSPVLTVNYSQNLSRIGYGNNRIIGLGKCKSRIEEDEGMKRLPFMYEYHGLGKGRYLGKRDANEKLVSVDSSAWLSAVRGRKIDVFDPIRSSRYEVSLKESKGLAAIRNLLNNPYYFDSQSSQKFSVDLEEDHGLDYNTLLELPHYTYYRPLLKTIGSLKENYR